MGSILLYSDFKPGISNLVDDQLLHLLDGSKYRIGYIPSDSDLKRRYFKKVLEDYEKIGIHDVLYFDLGEEYAPENLKRLLACDAIHLSGGDPVRFMELIRQRNFGEVLKKHLAKGGLLLGISAGAMILSRSLNLVDPLAAKKTPKKYSALRILDFEIYPHYISDAEAAKNLLSYARSEKTSVYAFNDDSGVIVLDGQIRSIGSVEKFSPQ